MNTIRFIRIATAGACAVLLSACAAQTAGTGTEETDSALSESPIEIVTDSELLTESEAESDVSSDETASSAGESAPEVIDPQVIEPQIIDAGIASADGGTLPIGEKADGENIWHKKLTNETGIGITGFYIKDQWEEDFSDNQITAGDTWKTSEERDWYYDASESLDRSAEEERKPQYRIHLLMEDGTEATLYEAPVSDFEEAGIYESGGIYYLSYTSVSGKSVTTLKDEEDWHGVSSNKRTDENSEENEGTSSSASQSETDTTSQSETDTSDTEQTVNEEEYEPIGEISEEEHEDLDVIDENEEEVTELDEGDGELEEFE